jgi:phage terminase small subunit
MSKSRKSANTEPSRDLTPKAQRFVAEYLKDLNATQAYLRSHDGVTYETARVEASRLMAKPDVQDAIAKAKAERSRRTHVTQDKVVRELARLAFSDMRDFAEWEMIDTQFGPKMATTLHASSSLPGQHARAIAEVTHTQFGPKVKLHDKVRALELLGKHLGMFIDVSAELTDEQLEKLVEERLKMLEAASNADEE